MSDQDSDDSNSVYSDEGSNAQAASASEDDESSNKSSPKQPTSTLSRLSDSDSEKEEKRVQKGSRNKDIIKNAAKHPDLYCIRRSDRQRNQPMPSNKNSKNRRKSGRNSSSDDDDDDDDADEDDEEDNDEEYSDDSDSSHKKPSRKRVTRSTRQGRTNKKNSTSKKSYYSSSDNDDDDDSLSDDDDDDDDDDDASDDQRSYKRVVSKKKNNRNRVTRGKASGMKISYKEESDDVTDSEDLIEMDDDREAEEDKQAYESIEKVIKRRIGRPGATGSRTTIYNIEKDGDPNEGFGKVDGGQEDGEVREEEASEEVKGEMQYLIKWKNWSYVHNTWETESSLKEQKVNGMKKLENFIRREDELDRWRRYASIEDQEYYDCQQELSEDLYQQYCQIEKIVHHFPKANSEQCDYLVKWQGLPYSECTQEDGALVMSRFKEYVAAYHTRCQSTNLPSRSCKALRQRPKFTEFKNQPSYIGNREGLELRDYQLEGLNWLLHSWCKNNGVILADEMGLGKTIQTISFLAVLMHDFQVFGPFLLVVPLSTLQTWKNEFETWSPESKIVVYIGDVNSRNVIREYEWYKDGTKQLKFNVVITTYEILLKDKAFLGSFNWAVLGVDEAHRLKNDDSLLYKVLHNFDTNHRVFITGTPLQNSLKELWSLLYFIMPDKFDSWESFERRHQTADKTGFRHLHQELGPYLLRRVKKDVEKSLPAKVEQILRVELSKVQKQYYKWIITKNYKALTKGTKGNISSFVNLVMELKKCCNHSFLVRPPSEEDQSKNRFELLVKSSGKLILLDKLLIKLKNSGHRVLIFSQMVRMLDLLAEYLQLRHFPYQRLDGTIKGDVRKQAMDHFNAEGSQDFCFLLSTRAGGLGVNLATADTVIIFDSDWNPQNDLQAMARAHRIGQKNQVSVYRLVTKNSVEEDIVERAKKKMVLDHLVIQRMDTTGRMVLNKSGGQTGNPFNKEELSAILKFGAEELFKDSEEEDDLQVDIDDILRMAETRNTDDVKSGATDELLSKFKVVSFDNLEDEELEQSLYRGLPLKDWEDIIPEEDRRRMDEEEKREVLKLHTLPPRHRKAFNETRGQGASDNEGNNNQGDDQSSNDDSDDGGGDRRRRRGGREVVRGCNESEIRRFLKSFKKFGRPLERLEDVSQDADLQDKSESDLRALGQLVLSQCESVMRDFERKLKAATSAEDRKALGRPTFKLGGIMVNARSVLQSISDLQPLSDLLPSNAKERHNFQIKVLFKKAQFDVDWSHQDDVNLLKGVFDCGMGNWEAIKADSTYDLQDKILLDGESKPQAKQLQARTEYLLKMIRKLVSATPDKVKKTKSNHTTKSKKVKSKEIIEDNDHSNDNDDHVNEVVKEKKKVSKEHKKKKSHHSHQQQSAPQKPLHFTTHETTSVEEESGLEPAVFQKCKEQMRAVKKSLNQLKSPDNSVDIISTARTNLLKVGDHIASLLCEYKEPSKIKQWRGFLWQFVSMFTTDFDASRLHKMYKKASKQRQATKQAPSPPPSAAASKHHRHHHHHHHHRRHRSRSRSSSARKAGAAKEGLEKRRKSDWDQNNRPSNAYNAASSYNDSRGKKSYYRDDRWRYNNPPPSHYHSNPPSSSVLPSPSSYQSSYRQQQQQQRNTGSRNDNRYYNSRKSYNNYNHSYESNNKHPEKSHYDRKRQASPLESRRAPKESRAANLLPPPPSIHSLPAPPSLHPPHLGMPPATTYPHNGPIHLPPPSFPQSQPAPP